MLMLNWILWSENAFDIETVFTLKRPSLHFDVAAIENEAFVSPSTEYLSESDRYSATGVRTHLKRFRNPSL